MLSRRLIPDFQSSTMGDQRSPNIFACPPLADLPGFVEDGDGAIGLDLANEVNLSICNWKRIWQLADLSSRQMMKGFVLLRFLWGGVAQEGRHIIGQVPLDEDRTGTADLCERAEVSSLPKSMSPQTIELFDLAIALRLADGQEDELDPQTQTQPHELTKNARRLVTPAKGGIVVQLQKLRDSKGNPGMQAVGSHCLASLVGGDCLRTGAGAQVQCMKCIHLQTVFEIPTRPIQRLQGSRQDRQRFRKISTRIHLAGSVRQVPRLQYALDGRQRRQPFACAHSAQFATDGACPDQPDLLPGQASPRLDNRLHHSRRVHGRGAMRPPRMAVKTRNTLLFETFFPFTEPASTAMNYRQNDMICGTFQAQAHRLAPQSILFFIVHAISLSEIAWLKSEIGSILKKVHDVVSLSRNKTVHDVVSPDKY